MKCLTYYFHMKTKILGDFQICTITYYVQKQPPEVFYKKGVLRNFAKFTGKHLCHSLFFNKVARLRYATLLKRDSGTTEDKNEKIDISKGLFQNSPE